MSSELRSAHVAANGITLAYDSFGDGAAETILLIAGLGTQMIRWTDAFCLELVTRGFRVVRFDNRDTGRSTHFAEHGAMDFATLASALTEDGGRNSPTRSTTWPRTRSVCSMPCPSAEPTLSAARWAA